MKGLVGIYGFKRDDTETSEKIIFGFKVLRHWKGYCLVKKFSSNKDYHSAFDESIETGCVCVIVKESYLLSGMGENCTVEWYDNLENWYRVYSEEQDALKPKRQSA